MVDFAIFDGTTNIDKLTMSGNCKTTILIECNQQLVFQLFIFIIYNKYTLWLLLSIIHNAVLYLLSIKLSFIFTTTIIRRQILLIIIIIITIIILLKVFT